MTERGGREGGVQGTKKSGNNSYEKVHLQLIIMDYNTIGMAGREKSLPSVSP